MKANQKILHFQDNKNNAHTPSDTSENFINAMNEGISSDTPRRKVPFFFETPSTNTNSDNKNAVSLKENEIMLSQNEFFKKEVIEKIIVTPKNQNSSPKEELAKKNKEDEKETRVTYSIAQKNIIRRFSLKLTNSSLFISFELLLLISNTVAYCLQDFSERIGQKPDEIRVALSFYIELVCNIIYVLLFLIKCISYGFFKGPQAFFRSKFNIFSFLIIIFSFLSYLSNEEASLVFKVLRLFRVLLFAQIVKVVHNISLAFTRTLSSIREIIFQMCFLLLFFSVFGLHMFMGLLESRCRLTSGPVDGHWIANPNILELCGVKSCPADNFCKNPSNDDFPYNSTEIDNLAFNYGLSNFDTIFNSILTGLNFLTFTGWSKVNDIYWNAYSKALVGIFSVLYLFILGIVMMNLLMAGMYEAFITHTKALKNTNIRNNSKKLTKDIHQIAEQKKLTGGQKNQNKQKLSNFKKEKATHDETYEDVEVYYENFTFEKEPLVNASNFKQSIYKILISDYFQYTIICLLLLDIAVLAADNYKLSSETLANLEKVDFAITWIFFLEILSRFIIFGPKKFFRNYFDILDLIIIVVNVGMFIWNYIHEIDNFYSLYENAAAIKCLKMLRIFRFLVGMVVWKRGAILFMEMIYSLKGTKEFILFSLMIVVVFMLIGRELFAYRVAFVNFDQIPEKMSDGQPPRVNYNGIVDAWIATCLVFLNEEWHRTMFNYQRGVSHVSALYFVINLLLGTVFMIKMFMMLYINSLLNSKNVKKLFKIKSFFAICAEKIKGMFLDVKGAASKTMAAFESKTPKKAQFSNEIQLISRPKESKASLEIFKVDSENLIKLPNENNKPEINESNTNSKPLDVKESNTNSKPQVMKESLFINLNNNNTNAIMLQSEFNKSNASSPLKGSLQKTEMLKLKLSKYKKQIEIQGTSLMIFSKENSFRNFIFKITTHPFFEKTILCIILFSIVLLIVNNPFNDPDSTGGQLLYVGDCVVLSLYFAEILLKIISFGFLWNGPNSFLMDIWNILDLFVFILTLLGTIDTRFHFSQYDFRWCRSLRIFKIIYYSKGLRQAMYNLFLSIPDIISLWMFYFMNLFFFGVIATKYLKNSMYYCWTLDPKLLGLIKTKSECFDYGGDWLKYDLDFNTIFDSLSSLFQISTTEGWMDLMFQGVDHVGPNLTPIENYNRGMIGFYIIFFVIANLIVMNMIIGIIVETYLHQKHKNDPASKFSENQKEWSKIKEYIYKSSPKVVRPWPKNPFRAKVKRLTKSPRFLKFVLSVTLLNTLIFMLYWHRQPENMYNALVYINVIFVAIFTFEVACNFIAEGMINFIKKFWNIFDVMIITFSWIGLGILLDPRIDAIRWVNSLANCIQVLRIIRVVKKIKFLRKLFSVFLHTLPQIKNIFFLMLLLLITYSIIGMNFFAFLKPQSAVGNDNVHFRNFFIGLINLARLTTGEGCFAILNDCARKQQPNFVCYKVTSYSEYMQYGLEGCGNSVAFLYVYSYIILNTLLMLNLFVAMILNAADEHKRSNSRTYEYKLEDIINTWKIFDPKGLGYIDYKKFDRFYKMMAIKLGVDVLDFLDVNNRMDFLKMSDIPIYENVHCKIFCIRFHDCLIKFAQMAAFLSYGKKDLEPEEGFNHLLKYEIKHVQNKDYEFSPFKVEDIPKLKKIYTNMLNFHLKKIKKEEVLPLRSFGEVVMIVLTKKKIDKDFLSNGEDEKSPLKVGISHKLKRNKSNIIEKN